MFSDMRVRLKDPNAVIIARCDPSGRAMKYSVKVKDLGRPENSGTVIVKQNRIYKVVEMEPRGSNRHVIRIEPIDDEDGLTYIEPWFWLEEFEEVT